MKRKKGFVGLIKKEQWTSCLSVCLFLCSASLWSESATEIAAIEARANANALIYAREIQELTAHKNMPESTAEIARLTEEMNKAVKADEPIAIHLKKVSQVLVFLSFSMPERSLQAWLKQCKKSGATPVIRGLIDNSFSKTMNAIQRLSKKTGAGMQLDPILFKTFEIEAVPAVVHVKEMPACPANMNCKAVLYDSLSGDVSLDYALDKMRGDADSDEPLLDAMISRLRGALV